jgi:peptidyl-prolyl cis-trans isomerase SurA
MMKIKIILFFLIITSAIYSQEVLDKIVAVVGNDFITQSELDFQTNMYAAQRKIDPKMPGLKKQVLDQLVDEKLIYAQANLDSITVTDDEVNQRIDYQIQLFEQQFGSKEAVEKAYGMSIEKIKRELQDNIRKQLMIQKLQQKEFGNIDASRRDVEDFFDKFKDSLGVIPEKVEVAHIFRNPRTSSAVKAKYKALAEAILDSLRHGADFAEMAKKYSDDPGSAAHGGDLGFVKKGVFYPEFEAAAFALKPGQISDVVESPVGFHIIQLLEKRGESIHTRHILIKIKNDEDADLKTIEFLTDVRDSIVKGYGTFAHYAKKYSEDESTKNFGGDLGTFYLNQLDKNLLDVVSKLKEGEISFPKRMDYGKDSYGYHIVYLKKRIPQHMADLNQDYPEIKKLADEYIRQKRYDKWLNELKEKIYYDIRL